MVLSAVAVDASPTHDPVARDHAAFLDCIRDIAGSVLAQAELLQAREQQLRLRLRSRSAAAQSQPIDLQSYAAIGPGSALIEFHVQVLLRIGLPRFDGELASSSVLAGVLDGAPMRFALPRADPLDVEFPFIYPLPPAVVAERTVDYCSQVLSAVLDVAELVGDSGPLWPEFVGHGADRVRVSPAAPHVDAGLGTRVEVRIDRQSVQPLASVASTEPAIVALARLWAAIGALVREVSGERSRAITHVQLRQVSDWIVRSSGHPSEIYEHLGRVCNVSCKFCYLYGNPASLAVARGSKSVSRSEVDTRLRHYRPERGEALFRAHWEINEFLVDPKLAYVVRALRERTQQPFYFVTNGNPLSESVIRLLAEVKPVHLIVSTNTVDEPLRSAMMHESAKRTRTALEALERLAEHEICFGVSLVAFPEVSFSSLERTIRHVEPLLPAFIRVNLPGFTREHPYQMDFDTDAYWQQAVRWVRELRPGVSCPIFVIPSAFEENFFHEDPNAPRVIGAVTHSPAHAAGLRPGDVVRRLGAFEVRSRAQLQSLLFLVKRPVDLEVEREGRRVGLRIDPGIAPRFPYAGPVISKYLMPLGVVCSSSISDADVDRVGQICETTGWDATWIVTSQVMLPAARQLLRSRYPGAADGVRFVVPRNEYLGGNIRILDMATIGDIARALDRELAVGRRPRQILVPGTGFNAQGRDLSGRHWADLERWFGIPVDLLGATPRFAF